MKEQGQGSSDQKLASQKNTQSKEQNGVHKDSAGDTPSAPLRQEQPKGKRKKVFTYSEEERKAFESAYYSGRSIGKLTLKDYYDRYEQSNRKKSKEDYRRWRQRVGATPKPGWELFPSPNQKEEEKS